MTCPDNLKSSDSPRSLWRCLSAQLTLNNKAREKRKEQEGELVGGGGVEGKAGRRECLVGSFSRGLRAGFALALLARSGI